MQFALSNLWRQFKMHLFQFFHYPDKVLLPLTRHLLRAKEYVVFIWCYPWFFPYTKITWRRFYSPALPWTWWGPGGSPADVPRGAAAGQLCAPPRLYTTGSMRTFLVADRCCRSALCPSTTVHNGVSENISGGRQVLHTEYTEWWPCPLFDILLNKYFPAG